MLPIPGTLIINLLYGTLVDGARVERRLLFRTIDGMNAKRMGRPPKAPAEKHTARLEIRMTDADLALIEKAAGGKTSTWARGVLLRAAKRAAK